MSEVRIQIVRYLDDSQPGWVEVRLSDAWGSEWLFVDKVPIFTAASLDAHSNYPQPGMIACEIVRSWRDQRGRELCTIDTAKPHRVAAKGGESSFDVLAHQLVPRDLLTSGD